MITSIGQRKISIIVDVLFTMIILPLLITMIPVNRWIEHYPLFASTLIIYLYILYFTYRKIGMVRFIIKQKYLHLFILCVVLLSVTYLISKLPYIETRENVLTFDQQVRIHLRSQLVWFLFLVVSGFSVAIELVFELFRQMLHKEELIMEKNKAELLLYKSQINPHFLFNTLNSIYGLVISKSDKAEKTIAKFSGIMQYMYIYTTKEVISISDELNYIRNYVDLQSLRLNSHTKVIMSSDIDTPTITIAPLILIVFVENAFKYGVSSSENCEIKISITVSDNHLVMDVTNDIMKIADKTGVGIENCRHRLDLLYPERYELIMSKNGNKYHVHLNIILS